MGNLSTTLSRLASLNKTTGQTKTEGKKAIMPAAKPEDKNKKPANPNDY